jgi:hypothetical protein
MAAAVEPAVDAVTAGVEALRRDVAAVSFGAARRAIEPKVRAIAAPVESLLDTIAAAVHPFFGASPDLGRASEQAQTKP